MKTKLELYKVWHEEASEGQEKLQVDIRWLIRLSLANKGYEAKLAEMQAMAKEQGKYVDFLRELVEEEEKKG